MTDDSQPHATLVDEGDEGAPAEAGALSGPDATALPSDDPSPAGGSPVALDELYDRVRLVYGAFGERPDDDALDERRVWTDSGLRSTVWTIAGVLAGSLILSLVSRPTWNHGTEWASSFRLDTLAVVVWGPLLYITMGRRPLASSVRTYLVLALFIEAFSETMFRELGEGGYWDSVLWPAAVAYFGTLKEFSGLPGASLSVFFFVTIGLLYRAVRANQRTESAAPPRFATNALLLFLGTIVALSVVGIARGGRIEWVFQQAIHLLQLPLVGLVFLYALRVPNDLAAIGTTVVVVAVVRSLLVVWVYVAVCIPNGITALPGKPEWCTTHSDTVLFVSALTILGARAFELRRRKALMQALGWGAVIVVGIVLSNRRLAFVSLAMAVLGTYLAIDPSRRKRKMTTALALVVPLLVGYVLIGAEAISDSPLWKPAKGISSILTQRDISSISRDIENDNLIYTLSRHPVIATGFGHEYEYSPNNPPVDLSDVFKEYRLIAHNGVLWLWSTAGILGFTLLWFLYPLAGTLAMRGYRRSTTSLERVAALSSLGCISACVVQIWGDQGFISYLTIVMFGVAFAVASRLAAREPAA